METFVNEAHRRAWLAAQTRLELRHIADLLEPVIHTKSRLGSWERASEQGTDEHPVEGPHLIDRVRDSMAGAEGLLELHMLNLAHQHPAYRFVMGFPGINARLICKLLGLIPMDGPHCLRCWHQNIPIRENVNLCWPCQRIITDTAEKKCKNMVAKTDLETGKVKKATCDRPVTWSRRVWVCPTCNNFQHDFPRFPYLRQYAGHVTGRNRHRPGARSEFNSRLRVYLYQAFTCVLKSSALVRRAAENAAAAGREYPAPPRMLDELYNEARNMYAAREGVGPLGKARLERQGIYDPLLHPDYLHFTQTENGKRVPEWTDQRQHLSAKNRCMDPFLYQLWYVWRSNMGWNTTWQEENRSRARGRSTSFDLGTFSSEAVAEKKIKEAERSLRNTLRDLANGRRDDLKQLLGPTMEAIGDDLEILEADELIV